MKQTITARNRLSLALAITAAALALTTTLSVAAAEAKADVDPISQLTPTQIESATLTLEDLLDLSEEEIQNAVLDENLSAELQNSELAYRPPRPGRGRGVQCKAENERYIVFYGQGPNLPMARDAALQRCYSVSRRCYMMGCSEIR